MLDWPATHSRIHMVGQIKPAWGQEFSWFTLFPNCPFSLPGHSKHQSQSLAWAQWGFGKMPNIVLPRVTFPPCDL